VRDEYRGAFAERHLCLMEAHRRPPTSIEEKF